MHLAISWFNKRPLSLVAGTRIVRTGLLAGVFLLKQSLACVLIGIRMGKPVGVQTSTRTRSGRHINLNHLTIYPVNALTALNQTVEPG
jgi:hypothetical protein